MRRVNSTILKRRFLLAIVFLFTISFFLSGCKGGKNKRLDTDGVHSIYMFYTNPTATTLQEDYLAFADNDNLEEKIFKVLEEAKTPSNRLSPIIPEELEVSFELQKDELGAEDKYNVILHVITGDYDLLPPNRANVFRVGLIKALFRLNEINGISLYKGNGMDLNNRISYVTSSENVIVNESDENFFKDTVAVKLYFIDDKGDHLTAETRNVNVAISESVAEKIVQQLIAGPEDPSHKGTIPEESNVNDVMIRNNICYVDMNEAFIRNHVGGELAETLSIYSIVNSLTQLYGVDSVQILINGQQKETYKGYVKINIPLSYNGELVSDV